MSLSESFVKNFHNVAQDIFSLKFEISEQKEIDAGGLFKEITFTFDFGMEDISQKVYYFIDKKFARNLFSSMIIDIEDPQNEPDITSKIIKLFNERVLNKLNNDLKMQCSIKNSLLIKDSSQEFNKGKNTLSVYYLSSPKGCVFIAFTTRASFKKDTKEDSKIIKSNYTPIIQIKEKKDEPFLLSTVQMIEIKKQVLMSINEIKDLKGDPDFLLRKAKTVSELTRLWFDVTKEEHS